MTGHYALNYEQNEDAMIRLQILFYNQNYLVTDPSDIKAAVGWIGFS